jgi:ribosomal protein S18 acetylase RimI-like enzyme
VRVPAGVSLRPSTDADRAFLEQLYATVRTDELAPTGWPDAVKNAFLASQFDLQHRQYRDMFGGADFWIVERARTAIGRFYVDRTTPALHVVEISLLPAWRGQGIGAALICMLQDEVRAGRGEAVILSVERTNLGARRLYERLGFVEAPPTSPYPSVSAEMTWTPAPLS